MKGYQKLLKAIGLWNDPKPKEFAQEENIYNPLNIKLNSAVSINTIDFSGKRFTTKSLKEYSISLGGENHQMVDYELVGDKPVRLRVVNDSDSMTGHRILLLTLYDETAYNEGLHGVVKDDTKKFIIDDDDENPNNEEHEFWRVNDVGISYTSDVKILGDSNRDGKISAEEVTNTQVEFWDYSRLTDVDGVEIEEFVFVEMNKGTGWFQIWRGAEVIPEKISAY